MSVPNDIQGVIHCVRCLNERKASPELSEQYSPGEYASLEVGFTREGVQIWCLRHDVNVMHIDFEGHKHPANVGVE